MRQLCAYTFLSSARYLRFHHDNAGVARVGLLSHDVSETGSLFLLVHTLAHTFEEVIELSPFLVVLGGLNLDRTSSPLAACQEPA